MKRKGFTLAELLVVIAIIGIMAAIMFPVISAAIRRAKEAKCIAQMHQLGLAFQMYRENYDERLPEKLSDLYPAYVNERELFACPLDPEHGQRPGTTRLEGMDYLESGVSYTFVPNWSNAIEWGWWQPWPDRGDGKWDGATPLSECHWHWAKKFHSDWISDRNKTKGGSAIILLRDGGLRYWPGKQNISEYQPR